MIRSLLAVSVVVFGARQAAPEFDDLEPCDGEFSWVEPPSPYHLALRAALLGEHRYRECQVLAIPSFEREWAVYIVQDEEEPPRIVFKRMKRHLYSALMDALSDHGRRTEYSETSEAQTDALRGMRIDVEEFTAPLSDGSAEILEQVWSRMLGRVRYPDRFSGGFDGIQYFASHWARGIGHRCGRTWSPHEGSRTGALVHLGEMLSQLAEAPPPSRKAMEVGLVAEARTLLARLEVPNLEVQPR